MAIRKKPDPIIKLETKDFRPLSKKDLINSIIKRKQKNKFLCNEGGCRPFSGHK